MESSERRAARGAMLVLMLVGGGTAPCAAQTAGANAGAQSPARGEAVESLALDLGDGGTLEFVRIPDGSLSMGDPRGSRDEQPVHKVTLTRPFYFGKYLVTQRQWEAVMGNNPSAFRDPQHPVDSVSWDGCQAFLGKLNERFRASAATFRLPTEAEWEHACRAGSTSLFYFGDDERQLGEHAWFSDNADGKTHPVGQKKPNRWGLYDLYGNVWQWCADWYGADYYQKSPASDPTGPSTGSERVLRGGSWYRGALNCRSADRYRGVPGCPDYGGGLRVVLERAPARPGGPERQR